MPVHPILGLQIELPWPVELPSSEESADYRILLGPPEDVPLDPAGESLIMSRRGSSLELAMGGICRMVVPAPGKPTVVTCFPDCSYDLEEVKRQILEHLIPRLLSRHHALVLHASCAVFEHGAVAFLAPSGSGKSTMALAMTSAGGSILGDDSLVLDISPGGALAELYGRTCVHSETACPPRCAPNSPTRAPVRLFSRLGTTRN